MKQVIVSMHLLVVGVRWPMETFLEQLLLGLTGKGFAITLASEIRPPKAWLDQTGIEWLSTPIWRGANYGSLGHLLFQSLRSFLFEHEDMKTLLHFVATRSRWLDRLAFWYNLVPFTGWRGDVIYFPWNLSAVDYLPLFDLGMPAVISCRGSQISIAPYNPKRADFLPGLRSTFEKAALVHCVSQDILEKAQPLGLDPVKARVVRPAVDPNYFYPLESASSRDGSFHVVTTGSLIWVKGLEYALTAIYLLKKVSVPVSFEIIGDGPERSRVLFTVGDLGLQDSVHLVGRLPPEQVRTHLQKADAFLLSSLSEGISNAVLEAMACGLPVVTTDCGGMREAVTDGVEGFVTPVRNSQAIAEKLAILAQDPILRSAMGRAARKRILLEFQIDEQLQCWEGIFNSLTGQ